MEAHSYAGPYFTLLGIIQWLDQHNGTVTATATVVLAIITWLYMRETRKQRRLLDTQLALAYAPVISVECPQPFMIENELSRTGLNMFNHGGLAEQVQIAFIIIGPEQIEQLIENPERLRVVSRGVWRSHFFQNEPLFMYVGFFDEDRAWLEVATKKVSGNVPLVHAYVQVSYEKPILPFFEKNRDRLESYSFYWNPLFNRWMQVNNREYHDEIESVLKTKGVLDSRARVNKKFLVPL